MMGILAYQDKENVLNGEPMDCLASLHNAILNKVKRKYPNSIDSEVLLELNRFLVMPSFGFKKQRAARHVLKIAYSHFLISREIIRLNKLFPERKHVQLRVIKQQLLFPFGKKAVLGLALGVGLNEKYELLRENHLLQSVLACLPNISVVQRSFYMCHDFHENIRLIYAELMKADLSDFSSEEIAILKQLLPQELESRIEKLSPTLFTTQNEEEILKSVSILGRELRYVTDPPQVMIFFDEQTEAKLLFSVIIVRTLKKGMTEWKKVSSDDVKCEQSRSQITGHLQKKYPKEVVILRLGVPIVPSFLRTNASINLYLAREKVASFITAQIGEFRDYNGGIILTRRHLLSQLKEQFSTHNLDFIESIFHSIIPLKMQVILPLAAIATLIDLFLEGMKRQFASKGDYCLKTDADSQYIFVTVQSKDPTLTSSPISTSTHFQGIFHLGFIYQNHSTERQEDFFHLIKQGIDSWEKQSKELQVLRLSVLNLPLSLDPRLGGDAISGNILRMLYEGLMRMGEKDIPVCGIAEKVEISPDLKRYTFFLREAYWSNGQKITAYDFEYAWKKILSPTFTTIFAYLFYHIKNAEPAKAGVLPIEAVGIKVLDDRCLQIDLESPTSYFLELLTHPLYSPIYHLIDKLHPDWAGLDGKSYVCNGPFYLHKQSSEYGYELRKNESYWDKDQVKLSNIFIFKLNPYKALEAYQKDEIDWLGRPLSPWETFFSSSQTQKQMNFSSIYWCVCNTACFPFNHPKIRQALSCAIDRQAIINALSYEALTATTPLPLIQTFNTDKGLLDGARATAQKLLWEALQELGLQLDQLPVFNFIHINREVKRQVAELIQGQWLDVLGIRCTTKGYEWKTLLSKMTRGDFEIGGTSWTAAYHPLYTLDIFKSRDNPLNYSNWENEQYRQFLNQAEEANSAMQSKLLAQAEQVLIQELPIIPIFYEIDQFEKKPSLKEVYLSKTGMVDFKSTYINGG